MCTKSIQVKEYVFFAPQLFWIQCDVYILSEVGFWFYIQNIDCNLLNQHNNCIQKLYKSIYTCCIWLVWICTWICDLYITVNFKKVEYKLNNYCITMNKTYKWPFAFLLMPYTKGVFGSSVRKSFKAILMLFLYSNATDSA